MDISVVVPVRDEAGSVPILAAEIAAARPHGQSAALVAGFHRLRQLVFPHRQRIQEPGHRGVDDRPRPWPDPGPAGSPVGARETVAGAGRPA